jgi:hypothetical protein
MPRPNYGPEVKKRARRLFEDLLCYTSHELEGGETLPIQTHWQNEKRLVVRTKLRYLEALTGLDAQTGSLSGSEIKEAFARLKDLDLLEDNRVATQGSDSWHFTLNFWYRAHERSANLKQFDEEWEQRRSGKSQNQTTELDQLDRWVELIREAVSASIQVRCGSMRVLDMSQPIGLNSIYTTVNIHEAIRGKQRRGLQDLLEQFSREDGVGLNPVAAIRLPGVTAIDRYSKLMVFGKPGAGKTAFLKWLAIQCDGGDRWGDRVPVFLSLKTFAEAQESSTLLSYIQGKWVAAGLSPQQMEMVLQKGRALILLDGLDEIREGDHDRMLREIRDFSARFHGCLFVMTCRIAAREYTFEQFTEVEITDFDDEQIADFVMKWFGAQDAAAKGVAFLKQLCQQQRIRDLATNPLLLTLLCLVFQEANEFPSNRSELYHEGLEVLLRSWDAKRNIARDGLFQRHDLYKELSLQCKKALLSQVAFATFEGGDYFFKQRKIEQYIADFLRRLPRSTEANETLEIDGEVVLKAIEAQHGLLVERARSVYSFSHLTFHEYFTAKYIADSSALQLESALQGLMSHVTEPEWHEVFLLTVGMLRDADGFLMMLKAQIDRLLSNDVRLQDFLSWLDDRSRFAISHPAQVGRCYQPGIVKAYHSFLVIDHAGIRETALTLASTINRTITTDRWVIGSNGDSDGQDDVDRMIASAGDHQRAISIAMAMADTIGSSLESVRERSMAIAAVIARAIALADDRDLKKSLKVLEAELPDSQGDPAELKQWWQDQGRIWSNRVRQAEIRFRNLVYDCQFSPNQMTLLDQYYRANLLLINCLNSDCRVSRSVRDQIEATLLCSCYEAK